MRGACMVHGFHACLYVWILLLYNLGTWKENIVAFSAAVEDDAVNYGPHTNSQLISMILFIYFPGDPRIIIAFRANPISQPLILHQSLQSASDRAASGCTHFGLSGRASTDLQEKGLARLYRSVRSHWY